MPTALQLLPMDERLSQRSILFVACNICPRAHVQFQAGEPLYSWRNLFGKADAFVRHVRSLEEQSRKAGMCTAHLKTSLTSAMCLWSEAECARLRREAQSHETIGVVGCESAVLTVKRAAPDKPIVPLAKTVGIANYTLRSRFFLTVDIVAGAVVVTEDTKPCVLPVTGGSTG